MWLRVLILALLLSSCLLAEDQPAKSTQPADGQTTTLKSHSVLVVVPVVVTDKSGNHVPGLKKEDFTVQENGVEQKISFFDEVTTNTQRIARPAPQANTFSNTLPEQPSVPRVTIMLLDLLNTKFQ